MAFDDNPIVDKSSKASEESVLDVRKVLSQENGFLSREETPDFGADLDIELINEKSSVSGEKFAVQIKSSAALKVLKDQNLISFSIKTSRIGYLCRRFPGYGIIVLYDSKSKRAYFDFVEEIHNRLIEQREDELWKEQESVNILIPISNVLDINSSKNIYERVHNRYLEFQNTIGRGNLGFKVPIIDKDAEEEIDFTDPIQITEALKKYGVSLLNSFEYKILNDMLSTIPIGQITTTKELLFIAAVTYSNTGKIFDADFFTKKCLKKHEEFTSEELNTLKLIDIRNDLELGRISRIEFSKRLQDLSEKITNPTNSLIVKIEVFQSRIMSFYLKESEPDSSFENDLVNFFSEIKKNEPEERQRYLLNLYHSENVRGYAQKIFGDNVIKIKISETMGYPLPMEKRIEFAQTIMSLNRVCTQYYKEAFDFGKEKEDELMIAFSIYYGADHFLKTEFGLVSLNEFKSESELSESLELYKEHISNLKISFNEFFNSGFLKDAMFALHNCLELNRLFKYVFNYQEDLINIIEVEERITKLTQKLEVERPESIVESAYQRSKELIDNWDFLKDEMDELNFARVVVESLSLPENRIGHVLNDIKSLRLFHSKCQNPNIEILQNLKHTQSINTYYATACRYILHNKVTGFRSIEYTDMEQLLEDYKFLCEDKSST